jgi:hypothetical protein
MSVTFTGNYREDLAVAKKLGIIKGNPKKEMLYNAIQQYENNISEWQKVSESDLADELIALCDTESDRPVSLLPKPILKKDRKPLPMPVKKNNQFRVKPEAPKLKTKLPVNIDTVLRRKPAPPRLKGSGDIMLPKLGNRFNRSLFQ